MHRAAGLVLAAVLITACGPSYEAEYHAAQKELESVKQQLAEAQSKLSAADHETRSKIFSLARRANTHLRAKKLDANLISNIQQEMALLAASYAQLNSSHDITALTAQFYTEKLDLILQLNRQKSSGYDRQYNACLSDLDSRGKKNELSTMLCEVQADAAARKPRYQYIATLAATLAISKELRAARQADTTLEPAQLDSLFSEEMAKQRELASK
ncbi:MAG: hypothetical protein V7752_02160 [Halopseudomonas sp.]